MAARFCEVTVPDAPTTCTLRLTPNSAICVNSRTVSLPATEV
jgi:hypothetical protein